MSPPDTIRADTSAWPRKWKPVFGNDHAQTNKCSASQSGAKCLWSLEKLLFEADHDAVGNPARVHHGEPREARSIGCEEQSAASRLGETRHAVHQQGERLHAAGDFQ